MARVHINLTNAPGDDPIMNSTSLDGQTITSSGTSQQATSAPSTAAGQVWDITSDGGDVWIKAGTNPTAVASTGFLVRAGERLNLRVMAVSELIAVIDAS